MNDHRVMFYAALVAGSFAVGWLLSEWTKHGCPL